MLLSKIQELCFKNGISITALEGKLGISKSSILRWDKSTPRIDNVKKVADFFGVTVDYLLEDDKKYSFAEEQEAKEEHRLMQKGRRLDDSNADLILQELSTILKNYGGEQISPETKKIPIVGTIKCGTNGIAYEDISSYLLVDESLHGELFVLRVKGDSMTGKGIEEDDLAIIRKQEELESGEIGAFLIDGEEATLKRYVALPNGVALEAANANYSTRYFMNEDATRVRVLGKLVEIRKRY